jgi:Putative amidoligase enzyme
MDGFTLPHPVCNRRGQVRTVGVEIEFGGVSLPEAAEAVRAAYGGELCQGHEHRYTVATPLGEFEVTFDSALLSDKKYEQVLDRLGLSADGVKGAVEGALRRIGGAFLPLEVSTPPIPVTQLREVNRLEQALRDRRAEGTRAGLLYAFALHFNPEAPDPHDAAGVANTLRAFLLLYDWLFRRADVDTLRRILPFINPFPDAYARHVIDPDYAPDVGALIDDYVRANPTRNRPLDLLPLLAFNDKDLTGRPELAGQKVSPRPTYHYRLPNSLIDDPRWSIAQEWDRWVLVERLAGDAELLRGLARAYLDWDSTILGYLTDRWVTYLDEEWVPKIRRGRQAVRQSA